MSVNSGLKIQPADVYASAIWLEKNIRSLDKRKKFSTYIPSSSYRVSKAQPREVYFLAKTLLTRSQCLSFQYTNTLSGRSLSSSLLKNKSQKELADVFDLARAYSPKKILK